MSDFLKLYEKHRDELYNFILGRVRHQTTAEDLLSEVFIKAIRFEKQGGNVTHARGLLYKIARNSILDYQKTAGRVVFFEDYLSKDDDDRTKIADIPDQLPSAAEFMDKQLTADEIQKLLGRLRHESREIIELRYLQELDIAEIAETLEKSEGAIRVQLHRALNELRDLFPNHDRK